MADQSVRACHPSKFYYFRRSLLISCCYILSPFISRPPPSACPLSHPCNPSIALHPLPLFLFLVLSLVPLNSPRPLPPLFISLLFLFSLLLRPVPSSTPGETREKDKRWKRKREKGERRSLHQRVIIGERNKTATESRARLFWFRGCCLFAPLYFIANLSILLPPPLCLRETVLSLRS